MAPFVTVDQKGGAGVNGPLANSAVCRKSLLPYRDHTVFACFGLAAADEVILVTVGQRNLEQLTGAAAAGYQDQGDISGVKLGFSDAFDICIQKDLPDA